MLLIFWQIMVVSLSFVALHSIAQLAWVATKFNH